MGSNWNFLGSLVGMQTATATLANGLAVPYTFTYHMNQQFHS